MSIRCSSGHENPDGSVFCDECGERLVLSSASSPGAVAAPAAGVSPATAPAADMPSAGVPAAKLVLEADGTTFDLAQKTEILVGREDATGNIFPDIDLTPHGGEEGGVSRIHARLYFQGNQYVVEDQNSTNYTFINRQKLQPKTPAPIKDGDEVRFGRVVMRFRTE
ncbi:MAG: FHA domain-containing protein [Ktedonobacterales bacterium]|nr:FHA domain-containing protein [Ktedonobacterales bacterium]